MMDKYFTAKELLSQGSETYSSRWARCVSFGYNRDMTYFFAV